MPPTTPPSGSPTGKCAEREQPPRPVHTNHALHPPAVIPAPPSVIPAQAGTTHPTPSPSSPIQSLPPFRGEVRWGVGSHEPTHHARPAPIPTPRLRRPRPLRQPAHFRHSCVGRNPGDLQRPRSSRVSCHAHHPANTHAPSPIHPSPFPGGRLGGGWAATSQRTQRAPPQSRRHPSVAPAPTVIPAPLSVIPAQAGTTRGERRNDGKSTNPNPRQFPNP